MKRETLEKLLIDRQLGELSPEAMELLDAYVQGDPIAPRIAMEIEHAVLLARRSMSGPASPAAALPPFPTQRVAAAFQLTNRRGGLRLFRPIAMAAAIGLAFLLGTKSADAPRPSLPSTGTIASAHEQSSDRGDFWSLDRLFSEQAARKRNGKQNIKWTTPMSWPVTGDAL